MQHIAHIIGTIILSFVTILLISFLLSWPVMALWNGCAVDAVTGLKEITWLQGWGLSILCGILFNKSTSK
jgi:hypothetical protein